LAANRERARNIDSVSAQGGTRVVGFDVLAYRPPGYAARDRSALIERLRRPVGRVLDVGCAKGAAAPLLRSYGASYIAGIELEPEYAEAAAQHFDEVVNGSVEEETPWEPGWFDTILCYDVLEHLVDPWSTAKRLARLLVSGGQLHVSVPNARHPGMWLPILVKGRFGYRAEGLRDVSHLRFFGRRDLSDMLRAAGLHVGSVDAAPARSRAVDLAIRLSRGRAAEFAAYQWQAMATR
jgi:2-polyprenyl-3-methyl-5-hydroxy-6-metoxy-1,4-benzoquinol methylase